MFDDKVVLVTGGTGSFGQEFIRTILDCYQPRKIIVFSRDELKQYEMQNSEKLKAFAAKLRYFLGDVRDLERVNLAMRDGVDHVIHAAALKHVPALEYNPFEAVKTNVIGGQNVITAAIENSVSRVIALSTDKAAAPVNLYGATKLTSDKLFVSANNIRGASKTRLAVVRYGNVMGSRGSAIPFFQKQKESGTLPITDPRMTRFNITLSEGVQFVVKCLERMCGGEIFVPKLPSYRITDVASAICESCDQKIIGIRPGEKIHEEMITVTDAINTLEFKDFFALLPPETDTLYSAPLWKHYRELGGLECPEGFYYSSGNNERFLSVEELQALIEVHVPNA